MKPLRILLIQAATHLDNRSSNAVNVIGAIVIIAIKKKK